MIVTKYRFYSSTLRIFSIWGGRTTSSNDWLGLELEESDASVCRGFAVESEPEGPASGSASCSRAGRLGSSSRARGAPEFDERVPLAVPTPPRGPSGSRRTGRGSPPPNILPSVRRRTTSSMKPRRTSRSILLNTSIAGRAFGPVQK